MTLFIDMGNKKNIINESASFNMPKKEERQKSSYEEFITKLLGKVILTKETFLEKIIIKIFLLQINFKKFSTNYKMFFYL